MEKIIIVTVCFISSVIGSICGIGGGVIIKPVLDATAVMSVNTISFLSGCTVLSMSIVSLLKNLTSKRNFSFDKVFATILAMGAVAGGISGKYFYQRIIDNLDNKSQIGAVQAIILMIITIGTLVYTLIKTKIHTKHLTNRCIIFAIGIMLGMMSSFLGIGGGPINLVVLFYLFSMSTKEAAMYSIYIIMFSQISSLLTTVLGRKIPDFEIGTLVLMVCCGVVGGFAGSKINKKISNETVDRLFIGVMIIIICINCYNFICYR